ncbi:hypothetical protein AVEN_97549-1 [Araneus ventricosus]|uniref:Uncharacterized protein n=1 Tax=Araneus ventricosus TaxID=182803 RepID=A0A4Y2J9D3_ARAVE|nr:hypothetical protein AVEN_97549-1 [Araneus ventricosus]
MGASTIVEQQSSDASRIAPIDGGKVPSLTRTCLPSDWRVTRRRALDVPSGGNTTVDSHVEMLTSEARTQLCSYLMSHQTARPPLAPIESLQALHASKQFVLFSN